VSRSVAGVPRGPAGRIRAVIADVDGTLTDRSRRLDPEAIDVVRALEDRGVPIILATGNVLPIALALYRSLGLSGPIIAENGGLVYSRIDGVDRVRRRCDRKIALRALRRLRSEGVMATPLFTDRWRETEVAIEPTASLRRIRAALRGLDLLVESTGYAIHLMDPRGGKLAALSEALPEAGLSLAECVALGDGDNDASMLRAAGTSVSFPSGSPRARRAARLVTRRGYAAGFVEGIIRVGLLPSAEHRTVGRNARG